MANIPNSAIKKFTKPAHREIAVGILIAYGLFPRTNEGIAAAERLIAGRETWLAPSNLPNYYDNIESDLMTGRETAGITNIRMILKEFYGLTESRGGSKLTIPKNNTTVYKPEDKLVDDIQEKLEEKLEETSDKMMDVVDALIEKQKKDFEDFKRKQQEELEAKRKAREGSSDQYSEPAGPEEPPVQGPKEPPKKTVAPENDEDWESEVPDQLGTKLDELIDQVKKDPLPQPSTKRRKTKGKKPIKRKLKFDAREMGLGESLNEILENVIETRETLFNLYKLNKERFEFKKDVDQRLTQLLQAKVRESQLEKPASDKDDDKKDKKESKKQEEKPSILEKGLVNGLVVALGSMLVPLVIEGIRPLFGGRPEDDTEDEKAKAEADLAEEKLKEEESRGLEEPAEPEPAIQQPEADAPVQPEPTPQPTLPLRDTSAPGDYDYREPSLSPNAQIPMRAAAKGGQFKKGKHEKLKPIAKSDLKETKVDKLTKVIPDIISLPQKAAAVGMITLANSVISPFSPFIPKEGREFINNIYRETSDMAGLKGLDIRLKEEESIFDKLKKAFNDIFGNMFGGGGDTPSTPPSGPPGGAGTSATASEEDLLKRLMIAEAGGEGEMGMAAVARSVINRAGLVQSGKMNASQFNAASGSISDIIKAPKQYSPYAQGKLERQLTPEENERATKALEIARNQADMRGRLEAQGLNAPTINKIMGSTGFRNYAAGAGDDKSQQVNEVQLGRHTFNTAGNAELLSMPYVGVDAPPPSPPQPPVPPPSPGRTPSEPPAPTPTKSRDRRAAAAAARRAQAQEQTPEIKPPDATATVSSPAPKQPSP